VLSGSGIGSMAMDVRAALLKVTADEPGSLLALEEY
jgi:hypothetical protein